MAQSRANPFRGFVDMFSEMERMRRLGRSGTDPRRGPDDQQQRAAWVPAADIVADGFDLVIMVELPGVRPADIDLTFTGGMLTISGERAGDTPPDARFYARERYHGAFDRSMILPDGVEESMIAASFADGLVRITVTGAARPDEPNRIPIEDRSSAPVVRSARKATSP